MVARVTVRVVTSDVNPSIWSILQNKRIGFLWKWISFAGTLCLYLSPLPSMCCMITLFLHVSSCFFIRGFSYLMCSFSHIRMSIHKIGSVFTFAVCLKVSLRSDREAVMETAYLAVSLFSLSICFTQRLSDCDCTDCTVLFDVLHYREHK